MLGSLFRTSIPVEELVVRALAVYVFLVILMRISGKRQLGQMSATEFVAVLLVSNAVQNSMNGGDNSLVGGLILAAVLVGASWTISWLNFRSVALRTVFEGTPRVLVRDGDPVRRNLRRELISEAELKTLLRRQGIHRLSDVQRAVLEADGTLTVDRVGDQPSAR